MSKIKIERKPDRQRLDSMGVDNWAIWLKQASVFPWAFEDEESYYFLEGDV